MMQQIPQVIEAGARVRSAGFNVLAANCRGNYAHYWHIRVFCNTSLSRDYTPERKTDETRLLGILRGAGIPLIFDFIRTGEFKHGANTIIDVRMEKN